MTLFVVSVALVLGVSAFCSLSEAALYSVRRPYVRQLADSGSRAGRVLEIFKANMERPITAILIVNTVANTAGAFVAGGQAQQLFGERMAMAFTIAFTLGVLFFSEILPKVAGVSYDAQVARAISLPWAWIIRVLYPLVWISQRASKLVQRGEAAAMAPEEEVHQVAALSAEEGSILDVEADLVRNVLRLDEVRARDIMTPRTVVFKLPADLTVREVAREASRLPHSRIPIHGEDPDDWQGFVFRTEILAALARDAFEVSLRDLAKPVVYVPDSLQGHRLLKAFLDRRQHVFAVIDEYGGIDGLVTLEDVLEELLGAEIVDETDLETDMQQVARRRATARFERDLTEPTDGASGEADDEGRPAVGVSSLDGIR